MKPRKRSAGAIVLNIILDIVIAIMIIFIAAGAVLTFTAQDNADSVPELFGKCFLTAQDDSMASEISNGDFLICSALSNDEKKSATAGTVLAYNAGDTDGEGGRNIALGRVISVTKSESGETSYVIKGDNAAESNTVAWQFVICSYDGTRISMLGYVIDFIGTSSGFWLLVAAVVIFIIYIILRAVSRANRIDGSDITYISPEEESEIRHRVAEELYGTETDEKDDAE